MQLGLLFGICAIAYLIGSIPFGLLLTRAFGVGDIRSIGSGNIGATNVMRTGRKGLAVATLLLDLSKGAAAVFLARYTYDDDVAVVAGLFAVLGHIFPVWLRFKGGKGVATILGVFFAINWFFALIICGIWLAVFLATRCSSLSAIISICYSPVFAYLLDGYLTSILSLILSGIIIYTHRGNLARLISGTEPAFGKNNPDYGKKL
jgi:glycerol-3-phosphate acyltransferase PlsY